MLLPTSGFWETHLPCGENDNFHLNMGEELGCYKWTPGLKSTLDCFRPFGPKFYVLDPFQKERKHSLKQGTFLDQMLEDQQKLQILIRPQIHFELNSNTMMSLYTTLLTSNDQAMHDEQYQIVSEWGDCIRHSQLS